MSELDKATTKSPADKVQSNDMADTFDVIDGEKSTRYQSAEEAGKAFFEADSANRPSVVHGMPATLHSGPGGSARMMAGTQIHGQDQSGDNIYFKTLPGSESQVDKDFRAGYVNALEKSVNARLKETDWEAASLGLDHRLYGDMELLAKHDPERAAKAWEEHAPKDAEAPRFIDMNLARQDVERNQEAIGGNESEVVNSIEQGQPLERMDDEVFANLQRVRKAATAQADAINHKAQAGQEQDTSSQENQVVDDDLAAGTFEKPVYRLVVPEDIERDYLRVGQKFHYVSKPELQAFEDKGNKLETKSNSEKVAADLVKIAAARGWGDIKVKGTDEFRRAAWLEASVRGIGVTGYRPTEADKAMLAKRAKESPSNSIEAGQTYEQRATPRRQDAAKPAGSARTATEEGKSAETSPAPEKPAERAAGLAGTLLEHGKANYNFDNTEKPSYFVKFRDDAGKEKIVWGIDLERAVQESKAEVGQRIELENKGRKPVTVDAPIKDETGKVVGYDKKETHRNEWEVRAEALRTKTPKEAAKEHPELAGAAAIMLAAEKLAKQHLRNPNDRQRFLDLTKESLAKQIETDKTVPEVKVKRPERERTPIEEDRAR